jgi:Tfp pilus assembly PilM family ATPase
MVEELRVAFSYATHLYRSVAVERVILVGGGALLPGLGDHLAGELGVECRVVTVRELADVAAANLDSRSAAACVTALGLAQFAED